MVDSALDVGLGVDLDVGVMGGDNEVRVSDEDDACWILVGLLNVDDSFNSAVLVASTFTPLSTAFEGSEVSRSPLPPLCLSLKM